MWYDLIALSGDVDFTIIIDEVIVDSSVVDSGMPALLVYLVVRSHH